MPFRILPASSVHKQDFRKNFHNSQAECPDRVHDSVSAVLPVFFPLFHDPSQQ